MAHTLGLESLAVLRLKALELNVVLAAQLRLLLPRSNLDRLWVSEMVEDDECGPVFWNTPSLETHVNFSAVQRRRALPSQAHLLLALAQSLLQPLGARKGKGVNTFFFCQSHFRTNVYRPLNLAHGFAPGHVLPPAEAALHVLELALVAGGKLLELALVAAALPRQ